MIQPERLKELNDKPEQKGDYVLYWMQHSVRESFNPALEAAIVHANRLKLPVVAAFGLTDGYPEANARHYSFLLEGLRDVEAALTKRGIGFVLERALPVDLITKLAKHAAMVVVDRGYLRLQKQWRAEVAEAVTCRMLQVEGDVVVPVELASDKREVGARTIRPKILRLREQFLHPLTRTKPDHPAKGLSRSLDLSDIPKLLKSLDIDHGVGPVARFSGGYHEARRRLNAFIKGPLGNYAEGRGEPAGEQVSFLSAYLHFGQISPVEAALAVAGADAGQPDRSSYLEELIIRRELAMNFVAFEPDYDRYACLPDWAKVSLAEHAKDKRPNIYSREDLEKAATHDPYWNAAMLEMRETGYMHNHMRMYWGKKILEWSPDPETGYETALYLNNKYFLCGRDANSFTNVAWCFGLHDRPWPKRPIFGNVRSMMASGLKRKIDIDRYVARVEELVKDAKRG